MSKEYEYEMNFFKARELAEEFNEGKPDPVYEAKFENGAWFVGIKEEHQGDQQWLW